MVLTLSRQFVTLTGTGKAVRVFLDRFSKSTQIKNLIEILPVVAELFHASERTDRRTGITELIVDFRSFVKAPEEHLSRK